VPFVLVARRASPDVYDYLLESCRAVGIVPNVRREASQVHTALALVGGGVGVSLLPQSASRLRLREVVFRPLVEPSSACSCSRTPPVLYHPMVTAFTEAAVLGTGSTL
jgi:DNA-binding transcriptional LysR family regulator